MAERGAILSRVSNVRARWAEGAFFLRLRCHFSSLALPQLSDKPEFQGIHRCVLLFDVSCHRLVRAADDSFRLRVHGDSADHPAAIPPTRKCAAVGGPCTVLLVGKHSRIMVP